MLQLAWRLPAGPLCLVSRARGAPYATLLRNFLTIFADEDRRRWQVEPLPLRFWRWRGSNLNKLKRLLHSFVSEIIVECAIKCAHHVINPNDLLDLLSCPPKTHLVQEPCFFHEKNTTNAAGKGSLFIVFHYYLSMGNHFKLEEWKQVNMVVLLLSLRKWKRGRDLYLTRGDHWPRSEKSSFFARKLLRFTILLQGETSMPFVKMTWRMCTFFFNRKHIHEKHHTSLLLGLLCSPLAKSASFQKMYNIPGLRKRSISCSLRKTTVMNLAKHLILHIFTICVNVYIISLKRAFIEKIGPIYIS